MRLLDWIMLLMVSVAVPEGVLSIPSCFFQNATVVSQAGGVTAASILSNSGNARAGKLAGPKQPLGTYLPF